MVGLEERGIPFTPQYGVSSYRIDFALAHPDRPGQFVLAVEADGDRYHSLPTVRDRDRLRQRVLEDKGWRFYRLSFTAWSRDRQAELDKIESAWRQAVDAIDNAVAPEPDQGRSGVSPIEGDELSAPPPQRRGPRPSIPKRKNIDEYSDSELTQLLCWIESDTLLRPEQELKQEMTRELGFKRLGSRIDASAVPGDWEGQGAAFKRPELGAGVVPIERDEHVGESRDRLRDAFEALSPQGSAGKQPPLRECQPIEHPLGHDDPAGIVGDALPGRGLAWGPSTPETGAGRLD